MKAISVILPVYNGMKFLDQCITGVLQQSFTDFEFLIVDDCSTDGSADYLRSIKDNKIVFFNNPSNKGLFYNLNFLIKKASSPLIKLWSQDDVMYKNCLQEVVTFHNQHPGIGFSYSARDYIDENGKTIIYDKIDNTPSLISTALHTRIAFYTGSIAGNIANVTLNKKALDEVGLFNETMKISGDFEMWIRLAENHPIGFIQKPILQLRNHSGQLSRNEKYYTYHLKEDIEAYKFLLGYITDEQKKEGSKLLRQNKLLFYYTLMLKAFIKGHIKTGYTFFKMLNNFDNIFLLSWSFILNRLFQRKKNEKFKFNNINLIYNNNAKR